MRCSFGDSQPGGSSPRVRGTRNGRLGRRKRRRFIPACAGNTRRTKPLTRSHHGSSPRVRGTHVHTLRIFAKHRFIPACAGNTCRPPPASWRPAVHPRVCGEHATSKQGRHRGFRFIPACAGNTTTFPKGGWSYSGSSPRVRGTRRPRAAGVGRGRFIPACAGNTTIAAPSRIRFGGSSPRVRGTHGPHARGGGRGRFIPACAGNTFRRWFGVRGLPVHPRVCGEHTLPMSGPAGAGGSSPRVRGTLDRFSTEGAYRRFIPACAGNTPPPPVSGASDAVHPRVCGEH